MSLYFHKTNFLFRLLYPTFVWKKITDQQIIYLTFDDGPIPGTTDFVLETLAQYQAKATFFCVGDNVARHPEVYRRVVKHGHAVGNHTFNHLNGWKTPTEQYLSNVEQCRQATGLQGENLLFRPPYGRITSEQAGQVRKRYRIVMWDVLTGDFDRNLAAEKCFQKSVKYTQKGSIVIFHDSLKAEKNLRHVLPRYLANFTSAGYKFEVLKD
jgi:peptidoglycan/xylan/chitin deacetylase (PgdA/CDA1 family)